MQSREIVGAGFQRHIGDGARGASEFGLEIVGRDVDGCDGFGGRDDDLQQPGAFIIVNAFDLIEIAFPGQSIDFSLQANWPR